MPLHKALRPGERTRCSGRWPGGIVLGFVAGLLVHPRQPAVALGSTLVFRLEVGAIAALASYLATAALWLAWHRTLFQRVGLGGAGAEPPAPEVQQRDSKLEQFMEETTEALQNHTERLEALEGDDSATGDPGTVEKRREPN